MSTILSRAHNTDCLVEVHPASCSLLSSGVIPETQLWHCNLPDNSPRAEVRDGKLFAVHAHHGEFELTPLIKNQFKSSMYVFTKLKFLRDEKGKVNALTVSGTKALAGSQFVLARDVEFSCGASLTFVGWNGSARGSL